MGTLVRHADDLVVMCWTKARCEEVEQRVRSILGRLGLELHPEKTRRVDLSWGQHGFDFLGCELRKVMSGKIWEEQRRRVYFLHRRPSRRSMQWIRDKIRVKTHRGRCHADLCDVIGDLNPITVRYPGGCVTSRRETSSVSGVRENRTHGSKGSLANTRPSTVKG